MKKKNRNYIIILLTLVLFISIGYALIATTLDIGGFANVSRVSWKIYFDNINVISGEKFQVEVPVANDKNTTTLNYKVALEDPGDEYSFDVDVVNDGTIDAMISLVNTSELTEEQKKITDYIITYSDGTPISEKNFLPKHSRDTFKVTVKFKRDIQMEDLPSSDSEVNLSLRLEYVQAKDPDPIRNNAVKSRVIKDLSGKGNEGVISDGVIRNDDSTITLDGIDDYADLGLDNYNFEDKITMVIRTKFPTVPTDRKAAFMGNWEYAGGGLTLDNGYLESKFYINGAYVVYSTDFLVQADQWYTIVTTYDGIAIKLYVNGQAVNLKNSTEKQLPVSGSIVVSAVPIAIGANYNAGVGVVANTNMTVSDTLVFNRALTAEEISSNYVNTIDPESISFDKILLYYDFNK